MNVQHERILQIIADLAGEDQHEVDEFSVAEACGAVPPNLPRHSWVNHPCRGEMLRILTGLAQGKFIYLTKRGYWGMYLTQRGTQLLERRATEPLDQAEPVDLVIAPEPAPHQPLQHETTWESPLPATLAAAPRYDRFYSTIVLAIAGLSALLIFAFGQSSYSPLARESAAASSEAVTTPTTPLVLPAPATLVPTATVTPPTARSFVVANTGGDGVFLRRSPANGQRLAAWAEQTVLIEIGPEQTQNGVVWRHVRTPDGTEGFVPAQYTTVKP